MPVTTARSWVEARSGLTYQFSNIVLGLEWDIDWAGNNDTTNSGIGIPGIGPIQVSSNNGRITTLAARFGSDVRQLALLWQSWRRLGRNNNGTITSATTGASVTILDNNTNNGWLVGAGIEWAFAANWSVKIEYDYLGLNSRTFIVPAGGFFGGDTFTTSNPKVQMAKIGFNYLFNYGVGRY